MSSNLSRTVQPAPYVSPLPETNTLWERASRSVMASGSVVEPAAGATIVSVPGFRTWQQTDIYRIDWTAFYDTANGPLLDMAIYLGAQQAFVLPLPVLKDVIVWGTIYVEAGDMDVSIRALAGSVSATYAASLVMTRLKSGLRVG